MHSPPCLNHEQAGRRQTALQYSSLVTREHSFPFPPSPARELAQPLAAPVPFPPSYEDRPDAPDRVFAAVDDGAYERLVAAWIDVLARAGADAADLLHLHHLTPANEAAARGFRSVPVLGQLHGTELAMLRTIEAGAPPG